MPRSLTNALSSSVHCHCVYNTATLPTPFYSRSIYVGQRSNLSIYQKTLNKMPNYFCIGSTSLFQPENNRLPTSIHSPKPLNQADLVTIELPLTEYASVGYMAKRIQMRKNRFLAIQKMAEQKKNEALHASNANINNDSNNLDLGPKQTVSPILRRIKLLNSSSIFALGKCILDTLLTYIFYMF